MTTKDTLRKTLVAGTAGLALLFGAACNDAGGEDGENGGVVENGGELEEGGDD